MDDRGVDRPPYQLALRLYVIATEHWALIDAEYASVDLIRFPPHRFLNCVWKWCIDRIPSDKLEEWEWSMNQPLPGREKKKAPAPTEADESGFMDLMGKVTSAGR